MQHEFEIKNLLGLHIRPARKLVELSKKYSCDVFLEKDGKRYSAKSLVNVLYVGATYGDKIILITEGEQEGEALQIIGSFLASKIE
ncbi:MAG: HPr family phosphocarrier protein [Paenibacillaceae bacterium]